MSPQGVRGNPYDPERFDSVSLQGDAVVLRLGRGHVQYVLEGARVADADERCLTWDPTLVESVLHTQGTFVRPQA